MPLALAAVLACGADARSQIGFSTPTALNTNAASDSAFDGGVSLVASTTGTAVAVWSSRTDLGGIGTDADLFVATSTDGGATWSAPAALNTNAGSDTGSDFHPRLATDHAGHWVVVWRSGDDLGGTIGTDADCLVVRSDDDGRTWSAPAPLYGYASSDSAFDANPDVITDGRGTWIAVWDTTHDLGFGGDQDVLLARSTDDGATWSAATALAPNAAVDSASDFGPTLATDCAGRWVAAWSTYDDTSDIFVSTSDDRGLTWSTPRGIRTIVDDGQDFVARLQTDRMGTWIVVWESGSSLGGSVDDDQDIHFARSTDGGASWSAPRALNAHAGTGYALDSMPELTVDRDGHWLAAWTSEADLNGALGDDSDVVLAYSADGGITWSAERVLAGNAAGDTGFDSDVALTTDARGQWLAAWSTSDDLGIAAGADSDLAVVRVTDPLWPARPAPLNTNADADTGSDTFPRIATDGQGNCVAVWMSSDDLGGTIGTDLDILVAYSSDGGATWSQPAALNTNAAVDSAADRNPVIQTGAGVWLAIWDSPENLGGTGTDGDILFARSVDDGQTWTAPAPLNTDAFGDAEADFDPDLATDGAGNWVATWTTDPFDTITAASTDNGLTWNVPVLLARTNGADFEPSVATDRNGLWVVVWSSNHDIGGIDDDDDIMICRSNDVGRTWTGPAPLNVNAGVDAVEDDDFAPRVATDGAGNWVAVWHQEGGQFSTFGDDGDVLTARSSDNALTWSPVQAISLNAATDTDEDAFATVSTDGAGRWLVAWSSRQPVLGAQPGSFDPEIVAVLSTDDGATFTAAAAFNSNAMRDRGGDSNPDLVAVAPGRWLATWFSSTDVNGRIGTDRDVLFAIAAVADPSGGPIVNVGGGCGSAGTISADGPAALGNQSFAIRLSNSDPLATMSLLNVVPPGLPPLVACGPCVVNQLSAMVSMPVVAGEAVFRLPLPCRLDLRGARLQAQWIVALTSQSTCAVVPQVSFTDRLDVTLDF